MESLLCSRHLIPTIAHCDLFSYRFLVTPFPVRRFGVQVRSKKSPFQDFQDYAKPRRLLPTTELEVSSERLISSLQSEGLQSLYKVLLRTSSIYGSGLSDLNAGILICLIDENGDSILKRIPAIPYQDRIQQPEEDNDMIHFQRGSTDEFIFWGPKLGKIQAIWICPESGTWRLAGASLTIISFHDRQVEEFSEKESLYHGFSYNFEVEDMLLGEGCDMTMAELRPCLVRDYSGADFLSLIDTKNVTQAEKLAEKGITNEDSMREYANLKYSILLYDAILIFGGTFISSLITGGGENISLAFSIGGVGGFLYLLLLQRSVDGLPAPESNLASKKSDFNAVFKELESPLLLVLAFALGISLVVKRGTPDVEVALTPKEILVGMMGFLACKVSVILAAFKPIHIEGHLR